MNIPDEVKRESRTQVVPLNLPHAPGPHDDRRCFAKMGIICLRVAGAEGGINVLVPRVVNQTDRVEAAGGGCVTAAHLVELLLLLVVAVEAVVEFVVLVVEMIVA
ncbi:hypothetical protein E2C01_085721 [Portunus trituberculatus]|uniref:Uncharacterized protein n=1 Tax=Portunus trituberculatus TaxID=210409 RepID=A0A5B7JEE6_PORTR|nr:hypothetical protein [Portunus trituberculatus]